MTNRCGSYFYVAPEVLNKHYRGGSCDLWSVGVVLFVMLVGYPPFSGDTDQEIAERVRNQNVSMSHERWDEISDEAKDLVRRLLNKDANVRIGCSQALAHPWLAEEATESVEPVTTLVDHMKRRRSRSLELNSRNEEESRADKPTDSCAEDLTASIQELHLVPSSDPASQPLAALIVPQPPEMDKQGKLSFFKRSFRRRKEASKARKP